MDKKQYNELTEEERKVIEDKGTELPFRNKYDQIFDEGIYICKRCNQPLFTSQSKFDAKCGWPAFDDSFPNSLKRIMEFHRMWSEIRCSNCNAHLGHEFIGENLTEKNTRECVNSLSIVLIPAGEKVPATIKL